MGEILKLIYPFSFSFLLIFACQSPQTDQIQLSSQDSLASSQTQLSHEMVTDILQAIPTAWEISLLLKKSFPTYQAVLLTPVELTNPKIRTEDIDQAFYMGVYATNMVYAYWYNQTNEAIKYHENIKKLEQKIGLRDSLASAISLLGMPNCLDSILIVGQQKMEINMVQLSKEKRDHLVIAMLVGAWIEAMYMTTSLYAQNPSPQLNSRIAEQKIVLEQMLLVLDIYKNNQQMQKITNELRDLALIFAKIKIITPPSPSVMVERDGELIIESNCGTQVEFGEEEIKELIVAIRHLREELIMKKID